VSPALCLDQRRNPLVHPRPADEGAVQTGFEDLSQRPAVESFVVNALARENTPLLR